MRLPWIEGIVSGFSGLTAGTKYYAQDTPGSIGSSVGSCEVLIGIAVSSTELLIQKGSFEYIGKYDYAGDGQTQETQFSVSQNVRFVILGFKDNHTGLQGWAQFTLSRRGPSEQVIDGLVRSLFVD